MTPMSSISESTVLLFPVGRIGFVADTFLTSSGLALFHDSMQACETPLSSDFLSVHVLLWRRFTCTILYTKYI